MDCKMVFESKAGLKISGRMFKPDMKKEKYPVVIFSHGFNGCYAYQEQYGFEFSDAGICCFMFDFCGGGVNSTSDGNMLDMTVQSECDDLEAVIRNIKALDYVDSERIYLWGESQGGFVSALVAAKLQEQISGLILWFPAFVIPDGAKSRHEAGIHEVFGVQISKRFDEEAMLIDIYEKLAQYKKPVLIIHGDQDETVPVSYSVRAAEICENAELIVVPGAGHGFEEQDAKMARERTIAFVK